MPAAAENSIESEVAALREDVRMLSNSVSVALRLLSGLAGISSEELTKELVAARGDIYTVTSPIVGHKDARNKDYYRSGRMTDYSLANQRKRRKTDRSPSSGRANPMMTVTNVSHEYSGNAVLSALTTAGPDVGMHLSNQCSVRHSLPNTNTMGDNRAQFGSTEELSHEYTSMSASDGDERITENGMRGSEDDDEPLLKKMPVASTDQTPYPADLEGKDQFKGFSQDNLSSNPTWLAYIRLNALIAAEFDPPLDKTVSCSVDIKQEVVEHFEEESMDSEIPEALSLPNRIFKTEPMSKNGLRSEDSSQSGFSSPAAISEAAEEGLPVAFRSPSAQLKRKETLLGIGYRCAECARWFVRESLLRSHKCGMQVDEETPRGGGERGGGELRCKPYSSPNIGGRHTVARWTKECPDCGRKFKKDASLKKHAALEHSSDDDTQGRGENGYGQRWVKKKKKVDLIEQALFVHRHTLAQKMHQWKEVTSN